MKLSRWLTFSLVAQDILSPLRGCLWPTLGDLYDV